MHRPVTNRIRPQVTGSMNSAWISTAVDAIEASPAKTQCDRRSQSVIPATRLRTGNRRSTRHDEPSHGDREALGLGSHTDERALQAVAGHQEKDAEEQRARCGSGAVSMSGPPSMISSSGWSVGSAKALLLRRRHRLRPNTAPQAAPRRTLPGILPGCHWNGRSSVTPLRGAGMARLRRSGRLVGSRRALRRKDASTPRKQPAGAASGSSGWSATTLDPPLTALRSLRAEDVPLASFAAFETPTTTTLPSGGDRDRALGGHPRAAGTRPTSVG